MALELVYTSAERGLRSGTSGFCTVAMSRALQPGLVPRLEALGGYRPGPTGDGPVARSFWRIEMSGGVAHVLSIVGPAPPDHTQRTNKIATYLVLGQDELDDAGPAWMLAQPGAVRTAWSGPAAWIEQPARAPGGGPSGLRRAAAWEAACGDAGWAGVLASAFLRDQGKPAHVIVPAGLDPLPLVDDAMHLLPPWARWRATFTTYFLQPVAGVQCAWRFCVDGTPGAEQARQSKGLVIDLSHPIGQAPDSRFVRMARTGTDPEGDAEAARQRREREARAAADRARAAQIRVVADPRTSTGATAPRTRVTPRGLPIELDEPVAPTTVGLPRGTKIALGVGGGVLLLATVALILLTSFGGQSPGSGANPQQTAAGPAAPAKPGSPPRQPEAAPPAAESGGSGAAAGGSGGTASGSEHGASGAGSGTTVATGSAKEPDGATRDPSKGVAPHDELAPATGAPQPQVTAPDEPPKEPSFPERTVSNFGTLTSENLADGKVNWKARWSGVVPQLPTSRIVVPEFMQEIVADTSAPNRSKVVMVGAKPAIQLETAGTKPFLSGNEAKLPTSLPRGWMPASAASLPPGEWLRLVLGRLLVDDGNTLFQANAPQAVELVAGTGDVLLQAVLDDAVWIEFDGSNGGNPGPEPQRAMRPGIGRQGRAIEVKMAAATITVELPADQAAVHLRLDAPPFGGSSPAEIQEQVNVLAKPLKSRREEIERLTRLRDTLATGYRPGSMSAQDLARRLDGLCQSMTEGELKLLVDANGKPVPFNRKSAGSTTQVALEIDKVNLVRGWAPALGAMVTRMIAECDQDERQLTALRDELAAVTMRLKQPIARFRLLGDDGYVIASVAVLPGQPPAKKDGAAK